MYVLESLRTICSQWKDRLRRSLEDDHRPQILAFLYHDIRARDNFRHLRQPYQKSRRKLSVSSAAFLLLILGNNNHDTPQLFTIQAPSKGRGMTFNRNHET